MQQSTIVSIALLAALATAAQAQPFFDDFNDGNDDGWTRYNPLAPFGAGGSFTFPGGAYRLQAPPSPDYNLHGPGRVAALAPASADVGDAFLISMVVRDYQRLIGPATGPMARVKELGYGTTDGYGVILYRTSAGQDRIFIYRLDDETGWAIGGVDVPGLAVGVDLRLTLEGNGVHLIARAFDAAEPAVPLAMVETFDAFYTQGSVGILLTAGVSSANLNPALDTSFDNFFVHAGPRCRADLTHGAVPGVPTYALPDGSLNNEDFFFYLAQFAAGNAAVADTTTGAVQGQPGYGVPDGAINNEDFFYYLAIFAQGC